MKRITLIALAIFAFTACSHWNPQEPKKSVTKTYRMTRFDKTYCYCNPEDYPGYECCPIDFSLPGEFQGCTVGVEKSTLHLKSHPGYEDSGFFAMDSNFTWDCDGYEFEDPYPSTGDYNRYDGLMSFNYFDGSNQAFDATEDDGVLVLDYYVSAWGETFHVRFEFEEVDECPGTHGQCYPEPGCDSEPMYDCVSAMACDQAMLLSGHEEGSWQGEECVDAPVSMFLKSSRGRFKSWRSQLGILPSTYLDMARVERVE